MLTRKIAHYASKLALRQQAARLRCIVFIFVYTQKKQPYLKWVFMYSSRKLLKGRHSLNNHFYAITICSYNKTPLFYNFQAACIAAKTIQKFQDNGAVNTICYTLMPDHLHWLLQLQNKTLSEIMRQYKSMTTVKINKLTHSQGQIWQTNYYEHLIRDESDLIHQARYIVANPLRAGLVTRVADYPFWNCIYLNPYR
ncbi:REP-associated tyrosine transposase [Pseudoalteromonas mariniglutinosa]|uniref:REP-associated tyrosine transposase n=1 Tax=Pseudoalteromonas mariniglutinosa TaxID=206042 RepID=UPI00384CE2E2